MQTGRNSNGGKCSASAPELALPAIDGGNARLGDLRGRPVLVVFLRHAGCLFCRTHLVKLLKRRERTEAAGAGLLIQELEQAAQPAT